tara:strand:+ start:495 stop:764 length:270 start_codon:yes stop_codon:yes gene_type:complete
VKNAARYIDPKTGVEEMDKKTLMDGDELNLYFQVTYTAGSEPESVTIPKLAMKKLMDSAPDDVGVSELIEKAVLDGLAIRTPKNNKYTS